MEMVMVMVVVVMVVVKVVVLVMVLVVLVMIILSSPTPSLLPPPPVLFSNSCYVNYCDENSGAYWYGCRGVFVGGDIWVVTTLGTLSEIPETCLYACTRDNVTHFMYAVQCTWHWLYRVMYLVQCVHCTVCTLYMYMLGRDLNIITRRHPINRLTPYIDCHLAWWITIDKLLRCTHSHTRTHTHTHTHTTHTYSRTHTHSITHAHTLTHTHSLTHAYTHTHAHILI